ncbi:MAG: 2-succinyl-5-enolpyruvyl-6-hydroxy-3-cyclohexene-1-carboxylic-acid synthase [Reichenbachiella sp.]|uniref:2-succinyl-5-enolpyruvyl-6-hydroxy-3- cyclohexene-1-carboxylic-acid synthase n=1 Tax=Reichenbachiella sp. TaxID=2184521 RepID=UPI00329A2602
MNLQSVFDLTQICHLKGIKHAVISPGSRNAALTIAFARHPEIKCFSVPDERSAAFIALGMSLKTQIPTVLICTSGSAALNYAPAVAEAYFNQIPLLILSADRPPEWIGQRDGQTIFQENLFGKHVKQAFVFPSLLDDKNSVKLGHQSISSAIDISLTDEPGPVHINVPFREPFYPTTADEYKFDTSLSTTERKPESLIDWKQELDVLNQYKKVLIVAGQERKDVEINQLLSQTSAEYQIPIVADIISNAHEVDRVITSQDVFLKNLENTDLQPDLLITLGMSVISKNLKLYLRQQKPKAHWHIRNETYAPNTYLSLTKHFKINSRHFLTEIKNRCSVSNDQKNYYQAWQHIDTTTKSHIQQFNNSTFSDLIAYKKVLNSLPSGSDLHLANSMAVRYANVIGLNHNQDIEVYCNRGTSGIDGSNSTAIGTALMTDKTTFLLTGDMAFLYDRNAFWHNHLPENLSIVVFNNHGGGIFRMIEGPSQQPELEEFFETRQQKDAKFLAKEFGYEYLPCHSIQDLEHHLMVFVKGEKRRILEIFTDAEESKQTFKELFRNLPK